MVARKEYSKFWTKPQRAVNQSYRLYNRSSRRPNQKFRPPYQNSVSESSRRDSNVSTVTFAFYSLPAELQILILEHVCNDQEATNLKSSRHINNSVSINYAGGRTLMDVQFHHRLDVPGLMVSKDFLSQAADVYARSAYITLHSAKEKSVLKHAQTQVLSSNHAFAAQIGEILLTHARRAYISDKLSPMGLGLPLSPPSWSPKLRFLDVVMPDLVYWTVRRHKHRFVKVSSTLPIPKHARKFTEAELNKAVMENRLPGVPREFAIPASPWLTTVMPELAKHRFPGHCHIQFRACVLVRRETASLEPVILTVTFNAARSKLLSLSIVDS